MKYTKLLFTASLLCFIAVFSSQSCKDPISGDFQSGTTTLKEVNKGYSYNGISSTVGSLGRVLFYDKHLSINNSVSCGSCHNQVIAFSDNQAKSLGFENQTTGRNTPPIQNLFGGFLFKQENTKGEVPDHGNLFWDGRETFLPSMVLKPMLNHVEMGLFNEKMIVEKVKEQPYYADLFAKAFPNEPTITLSHIATALSGFVGSISSESSTFDKSQEKPGQPLNPKEERGKELFISVYRCDRCHQISSPHGYLFGGESGNGFADIGLDQNPTDIGLGNVTKDASDNGKFKIPSLRNIALTAPYMHDGRFKTLEDVIEHYSLHINNSANLDENLKEENGQAIRLNINANDKSAIVAFLNSLTDNSMISDPKFSDPFIRK